MTVLETQRRNVNAVAYNRPRPISAVMAEVLARHGLSQKSRPDAQDRAFRSQRPIAELAVA